MYQAIYDFYYDLFGGVWSNMTMPVGSYGALPFSQWLCTILSIGSLIFIIVLCCLFVYKIIKLIGGLIR